MKIPRVDYIFISSTFKNWKRICWIHEKINERCLSYELRSGCKNLRIMSINLKQEN
jgi:hypothetical protein